MNFRNKMDGKIFFYSLKIWNAKKEKKKSFPIKALNGNPSLLQESVLKVIVLSSLKTADTLFLGKKV